MKRKPNASKRALVNDLCPNLRYDSEAVARLFELLDREGAFDAPTGELSVAFVTKDEISRLHEAYMDDPNPTDVITFPGDREVEQAGEICVCPEVAYDYASRANLDFSEELSLYLIHGYLHLCGFDDIEESDRQEMRHAEQKALKIVRDREAFPRFELSN